MDETRRDVAERAQHEAALVITGMGDDQGSGPDPAAVEREEVQVQRPRPPPDAAAAPERAFNPPQMAQHHRRRAGGVELHDAVEIGALAAGATDRIGLIKARHGRDRNAGDAVESGDRPLDGAAAVPEVRSEGDVGGAHFPSRIIPRGGASVVSTEKWKPSVEK